MKLGITKQYEVEKRVSKALVINDKVIDFLFDRITNNKYGAKYVARAGFTGYKEITKDWIKKIADAGDWEKELIVELASDEEDFPFSRRHPSPWDHRWEGDYDPDVVNEWKVNTWCLWDFFRVNLGFNSNDEDNLYYMVHPESFDWEEEQTEYGNERLTGTNPIVSTRPLSKTADDKELLRSILRR